MSNIYISGLTGEQVFLLDRMWKIETTEELDRWICSLPPQKAHQVNVLRDLLILSITDEDVENTDAYSLAYNMIMSAYNKHK